MAQVLLKDVERSRSQNHRDGVDFDRPRCLAPENTLFFNTLFLAGSGSDAFGQRSAAMVNSWLVV